MGGEALVGAERWRQRQGKGGMWEALANPTVRWGDVAHHRRWRRLCGGPGRNKVRPGGEPGPPAEAWTRVVGSTDPSLNPFPLAVLGTLWGLHGLESPQPRLLVWELLPLNVGHLKGLGLPLRKSRLPCRAAHNWI